MKRVVSISLGSSKRNARIPMDILGEEVVVERIGVDGDVARANQLYQELDGKVDAFGMGGINLYLWVAGRPYRIREAWKMVAGVKRTPIADGCGVKKSVERLVPRRLVESGIELEGKRTILVSAVDRYDLGEALVEEGAKMDIGDLPFALGVPIVLRSLRSVRILAPLLMPILAQLPMSILYPTGSNQEDQKEGFCYRLLNKYPVIAGDFHYIKKHLPRDLSGRIIITNTVTESDRELLKQRGLSILATASPSVHGRSFATNIIEAIIVALSGASPSELTKEDYVKWADKIGFRPAIERLAN